MKLTNDMKAMAIGMGADLVGVAPVERFEYAPESGKPQYYMHDARCVVVLATRILKGICHVHGTYEQEGKTIGPYMWHGYSMLNWPNSWIALQLGKLLEDNGYEALPFPPTGFQYRNTEQPDFYHKHAAVAAGLGEFGFNRLLLTPQFGARQRIISLITNAPLEPDPMYHGAQLCQRKECKDLCVKICPMKAYEDKLRSVRIGDRTFEYPILNSLKCRWHGIAGKYLRGTKELPRYPEQQQIEELIKNAGGWSKLVEKMNPADKAYSQFTHVPACGACLTNCRAPYLPSQDMRTAT